MTADDDLTELARQSFQGMDRRLCVLLRRIAKSTAKDREAEQQAILRFDLSDAEYARWFLADKIQGGTLNPAHALNDFVLFRVAYGWPQGATWGIDVHSLETADFSLMPQLAADLVEMSAEGLTDGYRDADWFLRVTALWYADRSQTMPPALFNYLQLALFAPPVRGRGRRRRDNIDRDRNIRNAYEGLRSRNCPIEMAQEIIAETLNMTPDAVRKLLGRTPRTAREERLWNAMKTRWAGFDPITMERLGS